MAADFDEVQQSFSSWMKLNLELESEDDWDENLTYSGKYMTKLMSKM